MIFGAINSFVTAGKQKRLSEKIKPEWKQYETSPYERERMGLARARLNARSAGAAQMEQGVMQNQANTMGAVTRNATDAGQALSAAMASQGQTNQALTNLQQYEAQDYDRKLGQLGAAQSYMTQEGDKVHSSFIDKYREDRAAKDALMNTSLINKQQGFNSLDDGIAKTAGMIIGPAGLIKRKGKGNGSQDADYGY